MHMPLAGAVPVDLSPGAATARFTDPMVLSALLPGTARLTPTGPGAFDLAIEVTAGGLPLRLSGTLTVAPGAVGHRVVGTVRHLLGGRVTLTLLLRAEARVGGCTLTWDGALQAAGVVAGLLRDRQDQVQAGLRARIEAARAVLERPSVAPSASPD